MIKDYYRYYGSRELMIVGLWINKLGFQEQIEEVQHANTGLHDIIIKLKNGLSFYIEVKEDSTYWFNKTNNIGLDYYSSFKYKDPFNKPKDLWIKPENLDDFKSKIEINKKGKLFTCDAEIQLFFVEDILCQSYSNYKLQDSNFVKYLELNYRLRVNDKKSYGLKDTWQSAAYYVNPFIDQELKKCEINSYEELLIVLKGENNG